MTGPSTAAWIYMRGHVGYFATSRWCAGVRIRLLVRYYFFFVLTSLMELWIPQEKCEDIPYLSLLSYINKSGIWLEVQFS